jgi:hypothetical protein
MSRAPLGLRILWDPEPRPSGWAVESRPFGPKRIRRVHHFRRVPAYCHRDLLFDIYAQFQGAPSTFYSEFLMFF